MLKTSYAEDIERLSPIVKMNDTSTILIQLVKGQISRGEAISRIYLENRERPPTTKRKYKGQMLKLP